MSRSTSDCARLLEGDDFIWGQQRMQTFMWQERVQELPAQERLVQDWELASRVQKAQARLQAQIEPEVLVDSEALADSETLAAPPEGACPELQTAPGVIDQLRESIRTLEVGRRRRRKAGRTLLAQSQLAQSQLAQSQLAQSQSEGGLLTGDDFAGPCDSSDAISFSGSRSLDRLLPDGGFVRGSLVEWLSPGAGSGAGWLALIAAIRACGVVEPTLRETGTRREPASAQWQGMLVVIDRDRRFYPPAALRWGLSREQLVVVQPQNAEDERWALDQALRSSAVAAVWARLPQIDERTFRRYQLAVEQSGALGMLIRPAEVRGRPSWSEVQLWVEPWRHQVGTQQSAGNDWGWQVELLRCRGGGAGKNARLLMDGSTGSFKDVAVEPPGVRGRTHFLTQPASLRSTVAANDDQLSHESPSQGLNDELTQEAIAREELSREELSREELSSKRPPRKRTYRSKQRATGSKSALRLAAQLAHPKVGRRSARA